MCHLVFAGEFVHSETAERSDRAVWWESLSSRCEIDGKETGGAHKLDGCCMRQSALHCIDERHP